MDKSVFFLNQLRQLVNMKALIILPGKLYTNKPIGLRRAKLENFLERYYQIPKRKLEWQEELSVALSIPQMEKTAAVPNPVVAMAQFQGQVIVKYDHHVKANLEWKSNKIEHFKKESSCY